jgi:hypothetical protein
VIRGNTEPGVLRSFAGDFLASASKMLPYGKVHAIREEGPGAAREAKALASLAFRNGPIWNAQAGRAHTRGEMSVHVLSSTSRIEISSSEPVVQMLVLRRELPALFEESASFPTFPRR